MTKKALRVAHLSDLHFSFVDYNARQFCSKAWSGNLNLLLFRRFSYQTAHLVHLPGLLETLKVERVFLTGDFATTSQKKEFQVASTFVQQFGIPTLYVPGNHDFYTKAAEEEKRFYRYFTSLPLEQERIDKVFLGKGWWWVGIDCACATPLFCAYGTFFPDLEEKLEETLRSIPKDQRIILGNHFPLFGSGRPRHDLRNADRLQEMLKRHSHVKLYLHGHDHAHYIIDRREEGYPLVLNSGSCAHYPGGTFYIIDLFETECLVQRLYFKQEAEWVIDFQQNYQF